MNTSEATAAGEAPSSSLSNQRRRPGVSPSHESKSQRMSAAAPLPAIIRLLLPSVYHFIPDSRQPPKLKTMMDVSSAARQVKETSSEGLRSGFFFFCSSFPECHAVTRLALRGPSPPRPVWWSLGYFRLLCRACLRGAVQRSLLHDTHTCKPVSPGQLCPSSASDLRNDR